MKVYKTNEIKNISLVGGKGAGKTTLTESILLETTPPLRKSMATLYLHAYSSLRRTARSSTSLTARVVMTLWAMPLPL